MDIELDRPDDVDNWTELMLIYTSALKQIETKLEILNEEFQRVCIFYKNFRCLKIDSSLVALKT